jgi:LPXTG-motif cell wall-anchored protein
MMRLKNSLRDEKRHYKMYKSGRQWTIAGISVVMAGIVFSQNTPVHAATIANTDESAANKTTTSGSTVVLKTSKTTNTAINAAIGQQTLTVGDSLPTTAPAMTLEGLTAPSWTTADFDYSEVDTNTPGTYPITLTAAGLTKLQAVNPDVTLTQTNITAGTLTVLDAKTSEAASATTETASPDSATTAASKTTEDEPAAQVTNVKDGSATAIAAAKQKAANTYKTTGTPQKLTATDAQTPGSVKVGSTTKTYDNQVSTPLNYTVTLSTGMKAPSGWYATGTTNQYEVTETSGDLDLTAVGQDTGSYSVTLSAAGLSKVQAANPNFDLSTASVTAGTLTIEQAQATAGAVRIASASKNYDDNAATDPASYKISIAAGSQLVAPKDWTTNTDGSYTVSVASGDLNIESTTDQKPGRYVVSLSAAGLADLQTANPNFAINSTTVSNGIYIINSNVAAIISGATVQKNGALPTTVTVTINNVLKSGVGYYAVPNGWTANSLNIGQSSAVYNVPISDFDTSKVDLTTVGNYTLNFNTATLQLLNGVNWNNQLTALNVQTGALTVVQTTNSGVKFNPGNMYVQLDGATTASGQYPDSADKVYYLSRSSALTMHAAILSTAANDGTTVNNLTSFIIIPAGFLVGTTDANGNNIIATDAAAALKQQMTTSLDAHHIAYSGLQVTQMADYNGRQAFRVVFDQVTQAKNFDDNNVDLTIVGDPSSTISNGYIGTAKSAPDDSVLYRTDDVKYTKGAYTMDLSGYSNVPSISAFLGVNQAVVLNSSYTGFVYAYQFVDAQVQDTYNLLAPDGSVLKTVTTTGTPDTAYDALSIIQQSITKNGVTYALQNNAVNLTAVYPKLTSTVKTTTGAVAAGNTYSVQYVQVLDTATVHGALQDVSVQWANGSTPTDYTITLPAGLNAPSSWTSAGNNTYKILYTSGDITLGDDSGAVGSTSISLSAQGLAALAAANPLYRFNNQVIADGTLNITPYYRSIPVTVVDTAGNQLRPDQNIYIVFSDDADAASVSVVPNGYSQAQVNSAIQQVTLTYVPDANGVVQTETYAVDPVNNQVKITVANGASANDALLPQPVGMTASEYLAQIVNDDLHVGTSVNTSATIADSDKGRFSTIASVKVTYRQQANLTINYVDDDNNEALVTTDTSTTGFVGDQGTFTTSLPLNYAYANAADTKVAYTLTAADNTLTVHLVHAHTVTPQAINVTLTTEYTGTKTPQAAQVQSVSCASDLDQVTGETTWSADVPTTVEMTSPIVAGYTADLASTTFDLSGTLDTQPQAQVKTVNYTPNTEKLTVNFEGLPQDKQQDSVVIDTAMDQPYTVSVPEVTGYTPSVSVVTGTGFATDETRTVTYTADTQTVTINYVDDTDGSDLSSMTQTVSGATDSTSEYAVLQPTGYELAANQYAKIGLTFEPNMAAITVHLVHQMHATTVTTTRTINYAMAGGDTTKAPKSVTQTADWNVTTDAVTGKVTAATATPYPAVTSPTLPGYTVERGSIAAGIETLSVQPVNTTELVTYTPISADVTVTFTGLPADKLPSDITVSTTTDSSYNVTIPVVSGYTADQSVLTGIGDGTEKTITVNYTANAQKLNVYYVDDVTGSTIRTETLSGVTDETGTYAAQVPTNYLLADKQAANVPYSFAVGTDDDITVHLVHDIKRGTIDTTRTINYTMTAGDASKSPAATVQTITWTTTTDAVSGQTIYTPATSYPAAASPNVTGYTADTSTVSAEQPSTTTDLPTNETQTVAYSPNAGKVTIHFVDAAGNTVAADAIVDTKMDVPFNYTDVPSKDGYTPSTTQVAGVGDGGDSERTVIYAANSQTATIRYVDDVTRKELPAMQTTLTGVTGQSLDHALNIPSGYQYVTADQTGNTFTVKGDNVVTVKFSTEVDQVLTVHLTHQQLQSTLTSLRVINYVIDNPAGQPTQIAPQAVTQSVQWDVVTDAVTGSIIDAKPQGGYDAVGTTPLSGYTAEVDGNPSITDVSAQNLREISGITLADLQSAITANSSTVTVTYEPVKKTATVYYVGPANQAMHDPSSMPTIMDVPFSIKVPVVAGYTAVTTVDGIGQADDQQFTVTYTPQAQSVKVVYHDDTDNQDVTGAEMTLSGLTGSSIDDAAIINAAPTGYVLKSGQNFNFTFAPDMDPIVVHLEHGTTTSALTTHRTITYELKGGDVRITPKPVTQTADWQVETDSVTGAFKSARTAVAYTEVDTPQLDGYLADIQSVAAGDKKTATLPSDSAIMVDYVPKLANVTVAYKGLPADKLPAQVTVQTATDTPYSVSVPTVEGYTPSMTTVAGNGDGEAHTVDVSYTADPRVLTVVYVDDLTGNQVATDQVNGSTDQKGNYTVKVPVNYLLAKTQNSNMGYKLTADGTNQLTVHLVHAVTHSTLKTTETINYVISGGDFSKTPAATQQVATWNVTTDSVTGESVATLTNAYAKVQSPSVLGYTPDQESVPGSTPVVVTYSAADSTAKPTDTTVTVTYTPDTDTQTFVYYDDVDGQALPEAVKKEGTVDTADSFAVMSPTGYELAKGQATVLNFTYTATDTPQIIHLVHGVSHGETTTTQTITYEVANAGVETPAESNQNVTWKYVTDRVTGNTVWTPQGQYAPVTTPGVAGYKADTPLVSGRTLLPTTVAPQPIHLIVNYKPTAAKMTIIYVDAVSGDSLGGDIIDGVTGESGVYKVNMPAGVTGYRYAKNQPMTINWTLMANEDNEIKIDLQHEISHSQMQTTRTINYVLPEDATVKTPDSVVQTINWNVATDEVTGATTATAQNVYAAVTNPTITGYTTPQDAVAMELPQPVVGSLPVDSVVLVAYKVVPTNGSTTEPGNGGTTEPGNGGTTEPGNGGTTEPGNGGTTEPGNGGTTEPGNGGTTEPGNGGTTEPGNGGTTEPGNGGTTEPGNGGTTEPGNGGTTEPGNGGTTEPGNGGTTEPGNGGTTEPGNGGTTEPGNGGTTKPGNGGTTEPGNDGTTEPGNGGATEPGNSGTIEPGNGGTSESGNGGTHILGSSNGNSSTESSKDANGSGVDQRIQQASGKTQNLSRHSRGGYPQTGDKKQGWLSVLGVALLGLMGIAVPRSKRHE